MNKILNNGNFGHTPVFYEEILREIFVDVIAPRIIVDATLGLGGHATGVLEQLSPQDTFIGIDRDGDNFQNATAFLENQYKNLNGPKMLFFRQSFAHLREILHPITALTHIYYDLGISSVHVDDPTKGFSFQQDGPLDMRFDRTSGMPASHIVNTAGVDELSKIFYEFGEEPKTRFIVEAILKERKLRPITTTGALSKLISQVSFDPKSKVRVFQALRIATNQEFAHIRESLEQATSLLGVGGKILIITFHSLEDRLVKQFFEPLIKDEQDPITGQTREKAHFEKVYKKPLVPGEKELKQNPRSRSAKLRIYKKIF